LLDLIRDEKDAKKRRSSIKKNEIGGLDLFEMDRGKKSAGENYFKTGKKSG